MLTIYDIARRKVKSFRYSGQLPSRIIWNGKNSRDRVERDGIYEARLSLSYKNGNLVEKDVSNIRLDARAPVGRLTVAPTVFTPDGDGENDTLFLSLGLRDFSGIRSWKMRIRKKGSKRDFRVFTGKGGAKRIKKIIHWDGKSTDRRDEVEAVEEYAVFFDAVDVSGNRMKTIRRFFTVGVLVEKTPRGLRIRVSSIRFRSGSSRLKKKSNTKLNKVIYIIRKILSDPVKYGLSSRARIVISGHTDDVGPSKYNLKLSVQRARAVRDYMIRQDINPGILRYKGMGESQPHKIIRPGMSAYRIRDYRSRNRRVEFFILK